MKTTYSVLRMRLRQIGSIVKSDICATFERRSALADVVHRISCFLVFFLVFLDAVVIRLYLLNY